MNAFRLWAFPILIPALIALGCADKPAAPAAQSRDKPTPTAHSRPKPQNQEAKIKANLAQLDAEDRELVEEQKFCAVETENRLGKMGKPFAVMIEDEKVFLCCDGCEKAAKRNPKKTLAHAAELRCRTAVEKLDPADRKLALEQKYCAVETENLLGSMGKPVKLTVADQTVFVCCKSCAKHAKADPEKTLATVKKLKADNANGKSK